MPTHAFVDEVKERGLIVCAAVLSPDDLASTRSALRRIVHPGSSRLHMTKERPARRTLIVTTILQLPVHLTIYDATGLSRHAARTAREQCLISLVTDLAASGCQRLVLERDDSLEKHDRRVLYREVRRHNVAGSLDYTHLRATEEPLLWLADAAAWCWNRGGEWRERVAPIAAVHRL